MKKHNFNQAEKCDKHQIFSIRKFNLGVASVAIAAFWMVSGSAVTATEVSVSPETAVVRSALVQEETEEDQEVAEETEPAQ